MNKNSENNENDNFLDIQLASIELDARQHRQKLDDHVWDLIGHVSFRTERLATSYGSITISVNRAFLRLSFKDCEMPISEAGYKRQMLENKTTSIVAEKASNFGVGIESDVGGAKAPKGKVGVRIGYVRKWKEQHDSHQTEYLVSFWNKDPYDGSIDYELTNPNKGPLLYQILGETDSQSGRLGSVYSKRRGGWSVTPSITFEPEAELPDWSNAAAGTAGDATRALYRSGRKKGIVSALVGKTLRHTRLSSLEMAEPDEGGPG